MKNNKKYHKITKITKIQPRNRRNRGKIDTLPHIHGRSLSSLRILLTFSLIKDN